MNSKAKIVLLVTAGFAVILLAIGLLDRLIVQPAFKRLEHAQALEDGERARKAIQQQLPQLDNLLGNWAEWDDAYAFADNRDPTFIASNLGDWTALEKNSHLNLCFIFDRDGRVLYGDGYDSDAGGRLSLQAFSGENPNLWPLLRPALRGDRSVAGLLQTERGLLLLAARPILTTRGVGPARGVMVFGRLLDAPLLRALTEQTKVAFEVFAERDPRLSPQERDAWSILRPGEPLVRPGPDGVSFVYESLPGIEGQPAALIRTPVRSAISTTARDTGRALMGALALAALGLLLGGAFFIDRARRETKRAAPAVAWGIATLAALIGLVVTAGVFAEFRQRGREALERRFQLVAAERSGAIIEKFKENLRDLDAVRRFFVGSEFVGRREFHRFVAPILQYRGFRALEWIPRVTRDQRAAFEIAAREDGFTEFRFTEQDPEGRLVPAGDRDEYFPVYYLEPHAGNEAALGFSPDSVHPARGVALLQAWETGRLTLGERYVPVQETAGRYSVLAFAPVYRGGEEPLSVDARRERLQGFVLGVIRVGDVVDSALAGTEPRNLVFHLTDLTAPVERQPLYSWRPSVADEPDPATAPSWYRRDFPVGDRLWRTEVQPTAAFFAHNADNIHRWALAAGVSLTALTALYLFATVNQRRRAEALVEARTLELREREQLFRLLFEKAGDGALLIDGGRFIDCNETVLAMLGAASREQVVARHPADLSPERQPDGRSSAEKADKIVAMAFRDGGQRFDWVHRRLDGSEFWVEVQLTPVPWHGQPILYAAWRDITERKRAEIALQESEERFRALHEASFGGIAVHENAIILECNQGLAEITGFSMSELVGMDGLLLVAPEWRDLVMRHLRDGYPRAYEIEGLRKDGTLYPMEVRGKTIPYQGRSVRVTEFRDISDRRRAEQRQRLAATVFEAARESIIVTDPSGEIVAVNPAFTALSGYAEAEVLGQNPRLLKSGRQSDAYYAALWRTVTEEGAWHGEFWNRRKDGGLYLALATISQVRDAAGQIAHYVGIATDITHQKEAEQRIEHLAYYDALTDLPNRTLLAQRAELAVALAERRGELLAVLFLDLDRFKDVNDSLGHAEGDILLVRVAARLKGLVRDADTVCRLGGDEFVLLLADTDRFGALRVAEKLLAGFRQPFGVGGHSLRVTVSIGIAVYPFDGATFDDLLKNADTALYRAKQDGRNTQVFYASEMNVAAIERLTLESELRAAIECDHLVAYFQPKVQLADGRLAGAEALVRWNHPERGVISPGRFIPVAEASDLIVDLGDWMLTAVCRQLALWREAGLPDLTVAVNLAARHFRDPGLVARLEGLLAAHGLNARALELELTESTLLEASERTVETLRALQLLGIGLAIDDFGTGYSNLGYLKRLPITALKIDQSFVRDLVADPDDRILSATIVSLGHSLGLKVVAEGVETEEQRRILLEQGCDLAQGYRFGHPMPADRFAEWFERTAADLAVAGSVAG
jgi:diguanylate cyclase (GGDEF)-like protein/PAS domain S-box-containing protein